MAIQGAQPSNGFWEKLENHCATMSLYVAHYNLCRVHESLRSTPVMALGVADRVWTIAELLDAALATQPITPVTTAPDRRKRFWVIDGGYREDISRSFFRRLRREAGD